ncbi:MAG: 2-phosphosulfolactate phosphatase [Phycisphaerales bacterium]|nr:2-phosphosulfolactate phosphatase [Phycisphaerales bacterium]
MTLRIFAHARPADVAPDTFAGATVVVIDVLRATTTIATALANGAREIVACASIEEARERAVQLRTARPEANVITGGERKGIKIEGFDIGNSPRDYTRDRVAGKTIVFTTTNGTVALRHADQAVRVLAGALVNRAAIAREVANCTGDVHLLCANTGRNLSFDDCITAGAITDGVLDLQPDAQLSDTALLYRTAWRGIDDRDVAFRTCKAGQNLIDVGLGDDIADCIRLDTLNVVGEMRAGVVTAHAAASTTIPA